MHIIETRQMKISRRNNKILISISLFIFFNFSAFTQNLRYTKTVFHEIDTLKEVEYAQADFLNNKIGLLADYNIHDGENQTIQKPLYMDIYMPRADTVTKRPAIIFAHSGAFLIGSRKADDMIAFCDSFARRGYVTATIDYRMGMGASVFWVFGLPNLKIDNNNGYRAAYRAAQDARAAIRFLKHNAEQYGIDTTKIYWVGSSAGAILGLYNIYNDSPDEFESSVHDSPDLGTIDNVGVQSYGGKANAVVSLWGGMQDTKYIENESTPVYLIHGTNDPVVPFKKGIPLDGIVPENPLLSFTMPEIFGSYCIDTALSNRNIAHETYFQEGAIHEFYGTDTGTFYESGPTQYWDTIQNKITHFFFHLFRPEAEFEYLTDNLEVHFSNTSVNTTTNFWDFGDGTSGLGNEITHLYAEPGVYKVHLTTCNQNMACDTLTRTITVGNSVYASTIKNSDVRVYPNPVKDRLYIKGEVNSTEIRIYDITGRIYFAEMKIHQNTIDVSTLQNGIYFIEISFDNQSVVKKFIKVN